MPSEAQSGTINTGLKINNSVLIVSAPFYKEITNCIKEGAISILNKFDLEYEELQVPGALEIPTAISILGNQFCGFIALGCVIRGETTHYDTVCQNSSRALTNCIWNGILNVENYDQAIIRSNPNGKDFGGNAARAAIALLRIKQGEIITTIDVPRSSYICYNVNFKIIF